MKKILLFLLTLVLFSITINGQSYKKYTATADSGDVLSTMVTMHDGYWLKAVKFPSMTSGTTSFKILAETSYAVYDTLWYDGAVYNPTIPVLGNIAFQFPTSVTAGYQRFKFLFPVAQDTLKTMRVIGFEIK